MWILVETPYLSCHLYFQLLTDILRLKGVVSRATMRGARICRFPFLIIVVLAIGWTLRRQAEAFAPRPRGGHGPVNDSTSTIDRNSKSLASRLPHPVREKIISRRSSKTDLRLLPDIMPTESVAVLQNINLSIDIDLAEEIAGPFFGLSLFPYLAFIYLLNVKENACPKGVTVGFATCLLFVFLSIPAAIAAKLLYGVSLADSDWLHGSAESLLTVTNLVTVVAFRQALEAVEKDKPMPPSATSYAPMVKLVVGLTVLAGASALIPALSGAEVHTPYLGGFLDLPFTFEAFGANPEPDNALTIPCWIIHVSSLVEFLVAMGFAWRWADTSGNPKWKGLTWGLLPLHSSGITACTYHLFYNRIPLLVPLQALLTCIGNTTAAYAAFRIARSNGWATEALSFASTPEEEIQEQIQRESPSLVGFEDLGDALSGDNDYSFLLKLFVGCAVASYVIKYGETFWDFPYNANVYLGLSVVAFPSALNAFKWYKRSQDPTFEGWF